MSRLFDSFARIVKSNFDRVVIATLAVVIVALYSPIFNSFFNSDDFNFLSFLQFNIRDLVNGQRWEEWFVGGIVNYSVFRPVGNLYWLLNYISFGFSPYGYHLVTIAFHFLATLAVFILSHQLTRNRMMAGLCALFFAMMPVHAQAVSWVAANYDVLSGMYFFVSLIFYILYRQKHLLRFYLVSLGAFVFALSSKETALTLPIILVIYDLLYLPPAKSRPLQAAARYAPFGILLVLRFVFFGHGYREPTFAPEGWQYYFDFNLLRVLDPLQIDVTDAIRWVAIAGAALLLWFSRSRPAMMFGLIVIPVTLIPVTVGGISDRSFYIPSFGVALVLAVVLSSAYGLKRQLVKAMGILVTLGLIMAYAAALFLRNQDYARASHVAQAIIQRVQELHSTLPSDARLVFVGVPDELGEGAPVFGTGFVDALQIVYDNRALQVSRFNGFPLWLNKLDRTFMFTVDHRRVTERVELMQMLQARSVCSQTRYLGVSWDFLSDSGGWEAWNDLSDFMIRGGSLTTRAVGRDPYMASPPMDIPSIAIGEIEIVMSVHADQPNLHGAILWLPSSQRDFSPGFQQTFDVKADGELQTYRVDIGESGKLLLEERISRLRLDPTDAPADIEIKSIRVYNRCSTSSGDLCQCP